MSDNDILSCKESIVIHQDPHNTEDSDEYQLLLGNCLSAINYIYIFHYSS